MATSSQEGIDGDVPDHESGQMESPLVSLDKYTLKSRSNGLSRANYRSSRDWHVE